MDIPYGELLDLISVEQVKHEGYDLKEKEPDFWELLRRK